jgi:hypothetical protein
MYREKLREEAKAKEEEAKKTQVVPTPDQTIEPHSLASPAKFVEITSPLQ